MPERTDCPACGAPLEYNNEGDVVRCDFCGADVKMEVDGGVLRPRVVTQPPVDPAVTASAQDTLSETIEDGLDVAPLEESLIEPFGGEPVAPGYASSGTGESATPEAFLGQETRAADDPFVIPGSTSGGAAVYGIPDSPPQEPVLQGTVLDQSGRPIGTTGGNRNRWIALGIAAFVVVCVLCACVAGAIMMFSNSGSF
jgi:hypothetical protein